MTKPLARIVSFLFISLIISVQTAQAGLDDIETAFLQDDFERVETLAREEIAKKSSQLDQARYLLGLSYLRRGEYADARRAFEALTHLQPDSELHDKAYLGLFDAYFLNEEYDQANQAVDEILTLSPHSNFLSLIYLRAAKVNLKLANWKEAKNYLEKIMNQFPQSLELHVAKQLLQEEQYFTVQVGSFMDRRLAEGLVFELKSQNEYAYIVETINQLNQKFFRVRVGQLARLDEARVLRSKLTQLGYPTQIFP